jgi:hypothetical protein
MVRTCRPITATMLTGMFDTVLRTARSTLRKSSYRSRYQAPTGSPSCCTARCPEPLAPPCAATAGPGPGDRPGGSACPGLSPGTRGSTAGPRTTLGRQPGGRNAASLVASMPPDAGAACDAAQKASHDQLYPALELSTVELDVLLPGPQARAGAHCRWHARAHHRGARRRPGGCSGRPRRRTTNLRPGRCSRGHASCARGKGLPPSRAE